MDSLPQSDDFKSIILNDTPLIDVRAPIEFVKGSFPNATNLPLMSNDERHQVGICYKKYGNSEATKLGHTLVSGEIRESRIADWCEFVESNPNAMLYCFRGGERSQISQRWLAQKGIDIVRLRGGYKAFRQYLIETLESSSKSINPIVLGGRTGSGKTILLQEVENMIDLEALANHRGSSFGRYTTPQPSQIDFENSLAYAMVKQIESNHKHIIFEDEGRNIGQSYLPKVFVDTLSKAPLIILERDIQERIDITLDEYVASAQQNYINNGIDDPISSWSSDILDSMRRIERRLGGLRYQKLIHIFTNAIELQRRDGVLDGHREWIEYLLVEYYDPMYDYQISKRENQILFRGNSEEVLSYIKEDNHDNCTRYSK
ncbi:Selenophosphate-dependent tRNA 2-selenouridine synthase [hydrothermal vent metagenome]|uniref:Selenophosphate-dependent tRNA 2-selenouridine synthase n=1 Tax=hydrothermal vent metagenome TaxID=652676 RepID=A0A1W1BPF4_9ZZZZ